MGTKSAFRGGGTTKRKLDGHNLFSSSKTEDASFSNAVKDMKSLLPGYDEATAFAYERGRHRGLESLGGTMPKPGRSIGKLNIEDLPKQFASNEVIPTAKSRAGLNSRQRATLDDYDLMSKFDATVFNPDTKLTQAAATKLKGMKTKAALDVEANTLTDNVRADYMKIKSNVLGEIESELGFGFRTPDVEIVEKARGGKDTQKAMQMAGKKTERSVRALKKKINSKSDEWENDKYILDSYRVREPKIPGIQFSDSRGSSRQPNDKLKELSDSFRKSLKVNTDMRRAIKTPRSLSTAGKSGKSKGIDFSTSVESFGHTVTSIEDENLHADQTDGNESIRSSLLTRSSVHGRSQLTSAVDDQDGGKRKKKLQEPDLSGILPLSSLLDPHSVRRSKKTDGRQPNTKQNLDYEHLKEVTSRLAESKNNNNSFNADTLVHRDNGGGETKILPENFYKPVEKKEAGVGVPVDDFLKQRLGESVKTVDDAATLATRLGSLMTRVAMSKNGQNNSSTGPLDTVSLARELREIASSMEKDYGGVLGSSGTAQTQTDKEAKLTIPQPKFTKQMSYTDQLLLQKLRSIRHEWINTANNAEASNVKPSQVNSSSTQNATGP